MKELLELAAAAGFEYAAPLDPAALEARREVREMCESDRCHLYGRCWTCPPHCGTLEDCARRMRARSAGLLVQSVGTIEDSLDWAGMQRLETLHQRRFTALADTLRARFPGALCLGAGGCRLCGRCAYPEPCRQPERACASMEGYGLLVTDVCRRCGLRYYYGPGTLAFTGCFLLP